MDDVDFNCDDINSVELLGKLEIADDPPPIENISTRCRYIIESLVLENFKSFVGVTRIEPFHENFTAIVGPNGSGKSNIIDSILFVFGFRAQKIRSKNLSVLIHKSSAFPNLRSCSVTILFRRINSSEGEHSFSVTRTALTDGSSSYQFDGARVSPREVVAQLKRYGIGIENNRFLILQGEVEQIALMRPTSMGDGDDGMLEYLEDIIGSNRYKEVIGVYQSRVERLAETRITLYSKTKQAEAEKNELREARDEAINYLCLLNDHTTNRFLLYSKHIFDLNAQVSGSRAEMGEVRAEFNGIESAIKEFGGRKAGQTKEYVEIQRQFKQANKMGAQARDNFKKLECVDIKLREEHKHLKSQLARTQESIRQATATRDDGKKGLSVNQAKQEELREYLGKLRSDHGDNNKKFQEVIDLLKSTTKPIQIEIEENEQRMTKLQNAADKSRHNFDMAQSELSLFRSETEVVQTRAAEIEDKLREFGGVLEEKKRTYSLQLERLPEIVSEMDKLRGKRRGLDEKAASLSLKIGANRRVVEEMKSHSSSNHSRSAIIRTLLEEKAQGRIPGVIGRLGDLGMIDAKYDVAISTACARLDNILVDSYSTAEKAIQLLKARNLGSATFVVLEIIEKLRGESEKRVKIPSGALRLFDLIRPTEDRFKVAFYHAIGNTLVTEDIDKAAAVAYGDVRYRVVTMDGQLIEASGTLSGGGNKRLSNRMGLASLDYEKGVNSSTLAINEQKLQGMVEELGRVEAQLRELDSVGERLLADKKTTEHAIEKAKLEIRGCEENIALSNNKLAGLRKKAEVVVVDRKALGEYEERLKSCRAEMEGRVKQVDRQREVVRELYAKLTEVRGSRFALAQKAVDETEGRLSAVNTELGRLALEGRRLELSSRKAEESLGALQKEVAKLEERSAAVQEELRDIDTKANELIRSNKESTDKAVSLGNELKKLQEEMDALTTEEADLKRKRVVTKSKMDNIGEFVGDCEEKMRRWGSEISKLSLKDIDGVQEELPKLGDSELSELDVADVEETIRRIDRDLQRINPNMAAIRDYKEKEHLYLSKVDELRRLTAVKNRQNEYLEEARKLRHAQFMEGFDAISVKLKEMYQMITLGGDAELELVDSFDPFSEGVIFSVRPPRKTWKNISNLSGGEKTMSSLSLVFALHHYKPSPLYVMDEIDAALDYRNVSIIANYIKKWTRDAQFVIISLKSHMFELCDRNMGVYKQNDCTRVVPLNNDF